MPFLTEELWQRLAAHAEGRPASIALAAYPQYRQDSTDYEAEREIGLLQEIVTMARTLRTETKLDPKLQLEGALYSRNEALEVAQAAADGDPEAGQREAGVQSGRGAQSGGDAVHGAVRPGAACAQAQEDAQRKRLEKEREQLVKNIANSERQLGDETFLSRAPAKVVETIREKLAEYETQLRKIDDAL